MASPGLQRTGCHWLAGRAGPIGRACHDRLAVLSKLCFKFVPKRPMMTIMGDDGDEDAKRDGGDCDYGDGDGDEDGGDMMMVIMVMVMALSSGAER